MVSSQNGDTRGAVPITENRYSLCTTPAETEFRMLIAMFYYFLPRITSFSAVNFSAFANNAIG